MHRASDRKRDSELVIARTSSGAEAPAERIPDTSVVSAFNTVPSEVLFSVLKRAAEPRGQASRTVATAPGASNSALKAVMQLNQAVLEALNGLQVEGHVAVARRDEWNPVSDEHRDYTDDEFIDRPGIEK